jgi:hypothetical protein
MAHPWPRFVAGQDLTRERIRLTMSNRPSTWSTAMDMILFLLAILGVVFIAEVAWLAAIWFMFPMPWEEK